MKKVYLYGKLGKRFGEKWELDVGSPIEAMSAIDANTDGFIEYLQSKELDGVRYSFKKKGSNEYFRKEEIDKNTKEDIIISPVAQGAGMVMGMAMSFGTSFLSGWIQNKMLGKKERDTSILQAQTKSYIYRGVENVTEQGSNVPLGYGKMKVGSKVISNSINNYEYDADLGKIYKLENGAYHLVPLYNKYRKLLIDELGEDPGPLLSSAFSSISDGPSEMGVESIIFKALKSRDPQTGFGSNDGVYGADVSYTGEEAIEKQKLGSGFLSAGTLYYKTIYNKGVPAYFLQNYSSYNGDWGPTPGEGTATVKESDLKIAPFTMLQSEPKRINDSSERIFYPINFRNAQLVSDPTNVQSSNIGNVVCVGRRYKNGSKKNGLGWYKFESSAIATTIDLICEGPIQGFCDDDGNDLIFTDAKDTTPGDGSDSYLKAVLLNDLPVKEEKYIDETSVQESYNLLQFDIDVARNTRGEIGANDQSLLERPYQFIGETKAVNAKLYGPRILDPIYAAQFQGTNFKDFNKSTPFYPRKTIVTFFNGATEIRYKVLRATDREYSPASNYVVGVFDPLPIVKKGTRLFEARGVFKEDPDNPDDGIQVFTYNKAYDVNTVVFEEPEYMGMFPMDDDDGDGVPNSEDVDQVGSGYFRAGPEAATRFKQFRPAKPFAVNDVVYFNNTSVYKTITAIPEGDLSDENSTIVSLSDQAQQGVVYFEKIELNGRGFLETVADEYPTIFTTINPDPEVNSDLWKEITIENPGVVFYNEDTSAVSDDPVFVSLDSLGDIGDVRPEEEYPIKHIITNPLVDEAIVSFQINQLLYIYPGDEVEVTYVPGATLFAIIGAITGAGYAADLTAESDEPFDLGAFLTSVIWGGVVGLIFGIILEKNSEFKIGTKIENSGETWPNKVRVRIHYGNEGETLYETDVSFFGTCTGGYIKDIKIYLPPNPLGRPRIIKAFKITRERNVVREGESAARYKDDVSLANVTEISTIKTNYPNSVVIGTRVSAKEVPQQLRRNYNLKLKKIKVPNNYDPVLKTYGQAWNGQFSDELVWTDNPAWCLYDLISNNVYGLGKFGMEEGFIDKWTFYKVAKFCDELVPTGYSSTYPRRNFKTVGSSRILMEGQFLTKEQFGQEFKHIQKNIALFWEENGYKKRALRKIVSVTGDETIGRYYVVLDRGIGNVMEGTCAAEIYYPVIEHRYKMNAVLSQPSNAFKLINEIADIFRAYTYWGGGKINFYQDVPTSSIMLFTNNMVSSGGFQYASTPRSSRTNSVKVKYLDQYNRYRPKIAFAENREKIVENGLYEESINALGVTSKSQAQRTAEFLVQGKNLETEIVTFNTAHPGSYLRPGDVIDILDNKKTVGRFAGKVLNIDVSGDGKVAYLDIDFPVRTIVDSFDNRTHKKIKLYNISGYNTLETLNQKSLYGDAITDEEIDSIRIGQIGEYTIGSITNNDTRVQVINNPYEHISGKFTFVTAMQDARLRGGDVASIANEVDQQFVGDVLPKDDNELAWIGGYYRETPPPEKFVWVNPQGCTDDEIDFYNWGLGYPKVGLTIAKDPLEDEFGNTEADIGRGRIANLEAQEGLETDSPSYPKPLVDESMEIIAENPDLPSGYNFICVSGSSDFEDHGDWITHDKNILKSYILERKTDDALLKLHDIEGTTFVIEDELNLATTKQYKVLNIIEEGDAIYKIEAMEYNSGKFGTIEDNATLPVPRSPIVMNTNFTPPPENIYIEMLDEDEELGLKYGLKIFWNEVSAARLYRVQVFHSKQLIKTLELGNKKINRDSLTKQISYDFRDTSIEEGKSYYVRIEAVP